MMFGMLQPGDVCEVEVESIGILRNPIAEELSMTDDRQQDRAAVCLKRLTLTFDNGPTPGITERVLDILARHGWPATFFVIGRQLRDPAAAALLPKIEQAGHRIGNHTLNHRSHSATVPMLRTLMPRSTRRRR
jgi:peptidoglycan/xylan/chitin deacetylase (PgdA/CDA1 family)